MLICTCPFIYYSKYFFLLICTEIDSSVSQYNYFNIKILIIKCEINRWKAYEKNQSALSAHPIIETPPLFPSALKIILVILL